jgi:hypothetical protein
LVAFSASDVVIVDLANLLALVAAPDPGYQFSLVECVRVLPALVAMIVPNAVNTNKRRSPMKNRVINIFAFTILALLWIAFAAALLFNREMLDSAWQTFRSWPLVLQIVVGLLVLPVALGLWIWETTWSVWLRLILVVSLGWITIYLFWPRKTRSQPETSSEKP